MTLIQSVALTQNLFGFLGNAPYRRYYRRQSMNDVTNWSDGTTLSHSLRITYSSLQPCWFKYTAVLNRFQDLTAVSMKTDFLHIAQCNLVAVQLGDHELASGDWREGEVLFPL
jgi:hypothetical protein